MSSYPLSNPISTKQKQKKICESRRCRSTLYICRKDYPDLVICFERMLRSKIYLEKLIEESVKFKEEFACQESGEVIESFVNKIDEDKEGVVTNSNSVFFSILQSEYDFLEELEKVFENLNSYLMIKYDDNIIKEKIEKNFDNLFECSETNDMLKFFSVLKTNVIQNILKIVHYLCQKRKIQKFVFEDSFWVYYANLKTFVSQREEYSILLIENRKRDSKRRVY